MAIFSLKPTHGHTILKADLTNLHNNVRTSINDVQAAQIGVNTLGVQHLPSVVHTADFKATASGFNPLLGSDPDFPSFDLTYSLGRYQEETAASVIANWYRYDTATSTNSWVLNGPSGSGYTLPPCKVLAFMTARIYKTTTHNSGQDHFSGKHLLYSILGYEDAGGETFDFADMGVVDDYFANLSTTSQTYEFHVSINDDTVIVEHPISIWTIIDKSTEPGDWTLKALFPRWATAEGTSGHDPPKWTITTGTLGIIAFNDF